MYACHTEGIIAQQSALSSTCVAGDQQGIAFSQGNLEIP